MDLSNCLEFAASAIDCFRVYSDTNHLREAAEALEESANQFVEVGDGLDAEENKEEEDADTKDRETAGGYFRKVASNFEAAAKLMKSTW
eukprot:CAMPEP_0194054832 /NCGR_PEP_ID=MMETSP0009_2-20130614/54694_1 /TAXON_ID=210454 /ORGANISM="Grammatophora oceanica, Strain CCMP 410" /LENGTH=88 /DNA_ID=CAMNT_0038703491 /DNA_START=8 /DNA_END=271 /DNA_ORIENTATION=+